MQRIKTLTLKQPWATLVAKGMKIYEFRPWKTNYRGKILIHAGAGIEKESMKKFECLNLENPSKKIIAIAEIVDCKKVDEEFNNYIIGLNSIVYGVKNREGYVFILDNIKKIDLNENINGQLGFWNYDIDDKFL